MFLSPEVALYLYKSTTYPCMKYCGHVWAGSPGCYVDLLDKLQKLICRIVDPSLATFLEPMAHRWSVASLNLFFRWTGLTGSTLPFSWVRSTHYSDRLHDFSVTIPRCYKDVYVNSFFLCTARLWNSLPIEWFPFIYDIELTDAY